MLQVVAISIAVIYGVFISSFVAPWYASQHALDLMSASLKATGEILNSHYNSFKEVSFLPQHCLLPVMLYECSLSTE